MGMVVPLFASEAKAAKLLDMKAGEFRDLVRQGILPRPIFLAGFERWDVEQLKAIAKGDSVEGMGPIEW